MAGTNQQLDSANAINPSKRLAVVMTCFNRRELTLKCLRSLFLQELPGNCELSVYLTDDGSSDGTGAAVKSEFPAVNVLQGDGNLYWAGGTQMAWREAAPADFYLWLNDDVELRQGAILTLFDVYHNADDPATITVGSTCDPNAGKTCTGGMYRKNWFNVSVMEPTDHPQPCDTFNGNIVLIPSASVDRVGMLDDSYTHFFADGDYGLRAKRAGIPLLLAPGHLGTCELNPLANSSFDPNLTIRQRWQKLLGPKGYRPPRQWWAFVRSHAPRPKVVFWCVPYVLFFIESLAGGKIRLRRDVKTPMEVT